MGRPCEAGWVCVDAGLNPHDDFLSFDHFGFAFLAIFQCLTMEGWDIYTHICVFYFLLLVILGSFLILNLALAVINEEFVRIRTEADEERWRAITEMQEALLVADEQLKALKLGNTSLDSIVDFRWRRRVRVRAMTAPTISLLVLRPPGGSRRPQASQRRRGGGAKSPAVKSSSKKSVKKKKVAAAAAVFQPTIILCITLNTVLLACEYQGQSKAWGDFLDQGNVVLTIIFAVEMMLKLMATFRLLRVFKLLKNFPELRQLVQVILHAVSETGYLNLIILLYLFIAALVGMQIFGDERLRSDETNAHFNDITYSIFTVFQVLTRDDWVDVMWQTMTATTWA
eukprot:gene31477-15263_t